MIVLVSFMLRQTKPSALSLSYFSCMALLICSGLRAQENCNVEVKLLLSPAQTQAVIAALSAKKETTGRVYFFDTGALDLLSQGAIVRLRQSAKNDLTVKLRPRNGKKFSPTPEGRGRFKCEVDLLERGRTRPIRLRDKSPRRNSLNQELTYPSPEPGANQAVRGCTGFH